MSCVAITWAGTPSSTDDVQQWFPDARWVHGNQLRVRTPDGMVFLEPGDTVTLAVEVQRKGES